MLKDHKQIVKSVRPICLHDNLTDNPFKDRDRKAAKLQDNDMTDEQLLEMQQSLFAQSMARFTNGEPAPLP